METRTNNLRLSARAPVDSARAVVLKPPPQSGSIVQDVRNASMRLLIIIVAFGAVGTLVFVGLGHGHPAALRFEISPARLAANGYASASLHTNMLASFAIVEGQHAAHIDGSRIVAGVLGGRVVVEARARGYRPVRATLETAAQKPEQAMRLDDEADRDAFTGWFTWLAESQYFAKELAPEVVDCAALIRFAYREALREHDGRWAGDWKFTSVAPLAGVRKYAYPFTPVGAKLFATGEGYAEFADARTLIRYNTHFVSRDVRRALPGDLLFFHQADQSEPYHTMIFLGQSKFEPEPENFVVYHTGPFGAGPGEIRRPTVEELLRHPSPQWRPQAGNTNFVGIFRWNILRRN